jgi:hypothetical protein
MDGLVRLTIATRDWGDILVLRPIPRDGDAWGVLRPLKDTPWGDLIPVVHGDDFSLALHGHTMPLVRNLSRPPSVLGRFLGREDSWCKLLQEQTCMDAAEHCKPGKGLPECYEAPGFEDDRIKWLASAVAHAWAEGRYVVVVEGDEFSI